MKYLIPFFALFLCGVTQAKAFASQNFYKVLDQAVLDGAELTVETNKELFISFDNSFNRDSKRLMGKILDARLLMTCEQWRKSTYAKHKNFIASIDPCGEAGGRVDKGPPEDAISNAGGFIHFKANQTHFMLTREFRSNSVRQSFNLCEKWLRSQEGIHKDRSFFSYCQEIYDFSDSSYFTGEFRGIFTDPGMVPNPIERMGLKEASKASVVFSKRYRDNFELRNSTSDENKAKSYDPVNQGLRDCGVKASSLKKKFGKLILSTACAHTGAGGNEITYYGFTNSVKLKQAKKLFRIAKKDISADQEGKAQSLCESWVKTMRDQFEKSIVESQCRLSSGSVSFSQFEGEIQFVVL